MFEVAQACEFLAYWLGGTTRREIAELFAYAPRHVTTLIHAGFGRLGRATVEYNATKKRWIASDWPQGGLHGPKNSRDAVAVLAAAAIWAPPGRSALACPIVDTNQFRTDPPPETFRVLLAACTRRTPVRVTYRARTRDFATTFSPHALVRTAHRLHFRGYSVFEDVGRGHYWDLVPSRLLSAEPDLAANYVGASGDEAWHQTVMLRLVLHDHVPLPIRAAIRREHDMVTDRLDIGPLPRALLQYVQGEYLDRRYQGYEAKVWRHFLDPSDG